MSKVEEKKQDMIIQIYEIQTPSEAEMLILLGVDHIGSVILSEDYWKVSSVKETVKLVSETDCRSSLIPLFSKPDAVFRMLDYYEPDILHCCEALADTNGIFESCKSLIHLQEGVKKRFPEVSIMRSVPIAQPGMGDMIPSLELARMFEPVSDYFLTDTLLVKSDSQPVAGFVGITGQICDWEVGAKLLEVSGIPVILAGGLSPDNVADAIGQTRPAGVDSCTGTNALNSKGQAARFKKNPEKVRRFVEIVRSWDVEKWKLETGKGGI